jgi:hypothetical protein
MKKIKLILFALGILMASGLQAQVSVSINLGSPPQWGPAGYSGVSYYYLPDVEAYYDVQSSRFIYQSGGTWVHRTSLPYRYRNYDLYSGYKVVMTDYHGNTPYIYYKDHKAKYARGYHGDAQRTIGDRPGRGNPGRYEPARRSSTSRESNYRQQDQKRGHNQGKQDGHGKGRKK